MVALFLLALLALAQPCLAQQQSSNAADVAALLALKAEFANGAAILSSWAAGSDPCGGQWLGVVCTGGLVTTIQLSQLGLEGTIPPAGFTLPEKLEALALDTNSLAGTLSAAWRLPPGLTELSLYSNKISGSLPSNWELPAGLRNFWIGNNAFSGPLPPKDFLLPNSLASLDLMNCNFDADSPLTSWQLPENLTDLMLSENKFNWSVEQLIQWRLPPRLKMLWLAKTGLTGPIPAKVPLPETLLDLAIWGNPLFEISPEWVLPPSLTSFQLFRCNLTGPVPNWNLPSSLQTLDISENSFSGTLPSWPQLTNTIAYVFPGNEGVCGPVPSTPIWSDISTGAPIANQSGCPVEQASSSSNWQAIVGGVVGGVGGAALLGLAMWYWLRAKKVPKVTPGTKTAALQSEPGKPFPDLEAGKSSLESRSATPASLYLTDQHEDLPDDRDAQELFASDPLLASLVSKLSSTGATQLSSQPSLGQTSSESALPSTRQGSEERKSSSKSMKSASVKMEQWLVPFSGLRLKRQLGKGGFGQVYLASLRETLVAAKLLLGSTSQLGDVDKVAEALLSWSSEADANLQREAKIMAGLRHPNILGFMGLCLQPPVIISEYCPQGSVHDTLRAARTSPALAQQLTWAVRLRMALQTALGMHYLHSRSPPILHRDLKTPNLLIGPGWTIKIADFNLSKMLEEGEGSRLGVASSTNFVTNPRWLAPEVLAGEPATFASDVYAFGLVLYELLTWEAPWADIADNPFQIVTAVTAGQRPCVPSDAELPGGGSPVLDAYKDLMRKCWAQQPEERCTFNDAIQELGGMLTLLSAESHHDSGSG